ncbi:DUF3095 family protein [Pedobacter sp. UYP1]|uniref:DUF3095 family protein n=1 Tax=Pedobacter sp. UYP1 TaxID=1756396 RepID=UPI0033948997
MKANTDVFYTELPMHHMGLADLLSKEKLFFKVPADWHIIITDLKNSTKAVLHGEHQTVNFLATGSIVAVLNIANNMNVDVPFFFGGDGATFIVPPLIIDPVMKALSLYRKNTLINFNLEIRTGTLTVESIYKDGHELRIAKHSRSSVFSIPVVLGNGLDYAEKLIKGNDYDDIEYISEQEELDLSGMQCRWDRIAPPEDQEEVVALLVIARAGAKQAATLRKVMLKIEEIYGDQKQRQPISIAKLRLKTSFNSLKTELLAKLGRFQFLEVIKAQIVNAYGFIYFRTLKGKRYLENLIEMSDTLVIDGKINTIISGTVLQRQKLEGFLTQMETAEEIIYGLYSSKASIMSCYVRNMDVGHIHFVDGSDGGYTQASRMLKHKLRSLADQDL